MLDVDRGSEYVVARFPRNGVPRDLHLRPLAVDLGSDPGWESPPHPATISVPVPTGAHRMHLVGIFALGSPRKGIVEGAVVGLRGGAEVFRESLVAGRHYRDASDTELLDYDFGPTGHVTTLGCALMGPTRVRLDVLTLGLTEGTELIVVQTSGGASKFILFDILFEREASAPKCPFHSKGGGVALSELGGIVRMRDRVRFTQALEQVRAAMGRTSDLEEARSEALTFLAVVTAGMLEAGGDRSLHRVQLDAARLFDKVKSSEALQDACKEMVDRVVGSWLYTEEVQPQVIDRALSLVDRNFAKDLTDDYVAGKVGMSTSHFRYLFKQSVGQPFHKFLIATRLEKARIMLEQSDQSVSEIGSLVGFNSLASFSRAFAQRFGMSPSDFRKVRGL